MNDKILNDRIETALDALDRASDYYPIHMEIANLRAALEQPGQCSDEDDCTSMPWCRIRNQCQRATLEQQDQEPVACIRTWHRNGDQHADLWYWSDRIDSMPDGEHLLYTHPPRREWVGLTDVERDRIVAQMPPGSGLAYGVARAVETALKEKNT